MKTLIPFPILRTLWSSFPKKNLPLFAALAVLASPASYAASGTWNITGSGAWSGSSNWVGNVIADGVGATGDFSKVNIGGSSKTVTIDSATRTLGILTIGDAESSNNANYIIAATGTFGLIFDNGASAALVNQISTSANNTINAPTTLTSALTITNSSTNNFLLSGNLTGNKNITYSGEASGSLVLNGTDNSAFTGNVIIQSGNLSFTNSDTALNTSNTVSVNSGASFLLGSGGNNPNATIAGLDGGGLVSKTGGTTSFRTLTLGGAGTYSFSGSITNAIGTLILNKSGTGTQSLSGSNSYTGATNVSAGTLLIDGSSVSATTVSGGRLGGTGTITNTVTVTGGTLAPGGSTGDTILTVNGNVSMSSTSVFAVTLNGTTVGTNYDQLSIGSGSGFTISGGSVTLSLTLGYAAQLNDTFTIIDIAGAGTFAGSFANLAPSGTITVSGVEFTANNYGAVNDLVLTVTAIPEPNTLILMGLGISLVLFRARRSIRQA